MDDPRWRELLGQVNVLKLAGVLSAGVALLHVLIIFVGGPAYRYFGAGERMARLAEQGSATPSLITLGLTLLFGIWAAYAFSGAGLLRRLPLLRTGLITIGLIYTLRGVLLGPQMVWFLSGHRAVVPPRQLVFSAAALVIGLAYLVGTQRAWTRPGATLARAVFTGWQRPADDLRGTRAALPFAG
jgi:hypothetical protein